MSRTVNFIDAVRSGKRFRPVTGESNCWWFFDQYGCLKRFNIPLEKTSSLELHAHDYDQDFILEEKTITITESELEEAFGNTYGHKIEPITLKKELGF